MAKCDNCHKWGKVVYDIEIRYPETQGKFRNHPCFCDACCNRYLELFGLKKVVE